MAVNVVLPYAAASGDAALARQAEALYGCLPRPAAYGAVRHLDRALRQDSGQALGGAVRVDARRQQGMLQLVRLYCTQGGCAVPASAAGGPASGGGRQGRPWGYALAAAVAAAAIGAAVAVALLMT